MAIWICDKCGRVHAVTHWVCQHCVLGHPKLTEEQKDALYKKLGIRIKKKDDDVAETER